MSKEVGLAVQKAYKESGDIIIKSKNAKDCKRKLEKFLGRSHPAIDYITENYIIIKNGLTKRDKLCKN